MASRDLGTLAADSGNAVLVEHALTGDARRRARSPGTADARMVDTLIGRAG